MNRITNTLGILTLVAACSAWSLASTPAPEPVRTPEERIDAALTDLESTLEDVRKMAQEKPPGAM